MDFIVKIPYSIYAVVISFLILVLTFYMIKTKNSHDKLEIIIIGLLDVGLFVSVFYRSFMEYNLFPLLKNVLFWVMMGLLGSIYIVGFMLLKKKIKKGTMFYYGTILFISLIFVGLVFYIIGICLSKKL